MLVNGKCFTNLAQTGDYIENMNSCKRLNQTLAILDDAGINYHSKKLVPASTKSFIGLKAIQGVWKWENGRISDKFSDWKPGHPLVSPLINCSVALTDGWESVDCNSKHYGICEKGK